MAMFWRARNWLSTNVRLGSKIEEFRVSKVAVRMSSKTPFAILLDCPVSSPYMSIEVVIQLELVLVG